MKNRVPRKKKKLIKKNKNKWAKPFLDYASVILENKTPSNRLAEAYSGVNNLTFNSCLLSKKTKSKYEEYRLPELDKIQNEFIKRG